MARKSERIETVTDAHIFALERQLANAERDREAMLEQNSPTAAASFARLVRMLQNDLTEARRVQEAEAAARLASAPSGEVAEQLVEAIRGLPAEIRAQVLSAVEGRPRAVR